MKPNTSPQAGKSTSRAERVNRQLSSRFLIAGLVAIPCGMLLLYLGLALGLGGSVFFSYACFAIGLTASPILLLISVILRIIPLHKQSVSEHPARHSLLWVVVLSLVAFFIIGAIVELLNSRYSPGAEPPPYETVKDDM